MLLGESRALLLIEEAEKRAIRPMHLLREYIYAGLKKTAAKSDYNKAEAEDELTWQQSVSNRVKARSCYKDSDDS